jgi:hypothetical protein
VCTYGEDASDEVGDIIVRLAFAELDGREGGERRGRGVEGGSEVVDERRHGRVGGRSAGNQ